MYHVCIIIKYMNRFSLVISSILQDKSKPKPNTNHFLKNQTKDLGREKHSVPGIVPANCIT